MNLGRDDLLQALKKNRNLGHQKRNEAFIGQVALACATPTTKPVEEAGYTSMKQNFNNLISLYRFVDNDKVSIDDLRDIRLRTVLSSFGAEFGTTHYP